MTIEIHSQRAELRPKYETLFDDLAATLFRHDPLELNYTNHLEVADNPDEYEPEAGTILPRLSDCSSEDDCLKVIHEVPMVLPGDGGATDKL